jgi:hypothetical protein
VEPQRKPPSTIDAQGVRHVSPTWERLIDRQIREAMEAGKFDDLPFRGQRLPAEDDAYAGEFGLAFHMLRNAGMAPPWIEANKDVRGLRARIDDLVTRAPTASPYARRRDRAALESLVVEYNAAVARLNAEAPTDRQHRRPVRLEDELARYDAAARA